VGAKLNQEDEQTASGEESPLWSRTADGTSGVRMKRPPSARASEEARRASKEPLLSGQYRLGASLGPSSYGRAFIAEHVPTGRLVSVHFLPRDATSERVLSRDLPLAVAKCAQLSHPNVIAVEAYGRADQEGLYYVVTAPLDGESLADYLHKTGPLPVKQALALMRQIGRALRAAHKLGIVHGDLRPANVRIVQTPQGELARVVGFGKVALLSRESHGHEPTSEVRGITSPLYAAPELYHTGVVDPRSDVYALGALLFRLIAGEPPFSGSSPAAVMQGHVTSSIPSLRARAGEHVPPEVDALVMRCLEKQPERRFADVVAFMQAMRFALLDDSEFLSRDASDLLSLPPGLSRPPVNSILPTVPPVTGEIEHTPVRRAEQARTHSSNSWLWVVLAGLLIAGVMGEILWETHGPAHTEQR
jgi:serine/threonine protein kinase